MARVGMTLGRYRTSKEENFHLNFLFGQESKNIKNKKRKGAHTRDGTYLLAKQTCHFCK